MCRLFETIQVRDGILQHLPYHQARLDRSRKELFGYAEPLLLAGIRVPPQCCNGIFRLRVIYRKEIESVQFGEYTIKPVSGLKLVASVQVEYSFKYEDRRALEALLLLKEDCDDILIVKGGFITDTSCANIAFRDEKGWVTPANPLLKGTCRARLMEKGLLREAWIKPGDIRHFTEATLINTMLEPGRVVLATSAIR